MSTRHRLGILLSGRGSNFHAIADSIAAGRVPNTEIAIVISNKADAPGLAAARRPLRGGGPRDRRPATQTSCAFSTGAVRGLVVQF